MNNDSRTSVAESVALSLMPAGSSNANSTASTVLDPEQLKRLVSPTQSKRMHAARSPRQIQSEIMIAP
jgi:hypothetical protein